MRTHRVTVDELAEILREQGLLTEEQVLEVKVRADTQRARLRLGQNRGGPRGRGERVDVTSAEVVASMECRAAGAPEGLPVDEEQIVKCLAQKAGVPYEKIDPLKLDAALITGTFSLPYARRTSVLPLRREGDALVLAVTDPFDEKLFEELRRIVRGQIRVALSTRGDIQRFITEVYGFKRSVTRAAKEMAPTIDLGNLEQLVRLGAVNEIEANDQHVVNAVEYILHYAFDQRASDIHIEPKREHSQVRMRIDGVLHDIYQIPKAVHPAVVSRIKMLSRLDLAERRRPQDGRFKTDKEGVEVEMRVSSIPVAFGEKLVIRIFDPTVLIQEVADLGFDEDGYRRFLEFIERPNGLVLVTGPTGSGKTTTLYSALRHVSGPEVNVTSIEDPIEMVIEDFNQVAIQPKIGVTFAHALRHLLRQDPDIIMVGEIRDPETAEQAMQAALTGHLVLSTLHTNDSASSLTRLLELGVDPHLVASTLVGVVAQRLVRKVCEKCKVEVALTKDQQSLLGIDAPAGGPRDLTVARGQGCVRCRGTGLYGRVAVFEMLQVNDAIRELVIRSADAATLMRSARADGTVTLREAAVQKLAAGITSFEEVLRVTVDEDRR
ncbi:MAG: Flp pilus assembly complex ATPase component TadA [Proteobacteria bacterium]|jgi:general secretion pathway protein E|nr:Flp pilus assembly complex ATPase component TadA [Pseudomonadota bacterium]